MQTEANKDLLQSLQQLSETNINIMNKITERQIATVDSYLNELSKEIISENMTYLSQNFSEQMKENARQMKEIFTQNYQMMRVIMETQQKPVKDLPKKQYRIKYQNPENLSETWTGLGKYPRWLEYKLNQGYTLESFLLK